MNKTNRYQLIFAVSFGLVVLFWLYLFVTHTTSGSLNFWYSFIFGLIPFFGGLIGMIQSRLWGGLKSALGKAVFFVSLGLFLWGFGENIWSYYNFFQGVAAPYPSVADIGFAPSIFCWVIGTIYLSKATGAFFALRKHKWARIWAIILPLVLLVPSFYLQVQLARGGVVVPEGETFLKTVLDIAYPFGDFLALVFAALVYTLSYKYFGGLYKSAVVLLLGGLAVMYFADSVFSYTTTAGTYYNGDWGDLLLALGQFLMTFGILAFAAKPRVQVPAAGQEA